MVLPPTRKLSQPEFNTLRVPWTSITTAFRSTRMSARRVNHFPTLIKFHNINAPVTVNGWYSLDKHSGATAIRCELMPGEMITTAASIFKMAYCRMVRPHLYPTSERC